ncbi:MAG TPA: hypothetical protein VMR62_23910 [Bryobacteraceae bacterium]|nr:hypothetical protein [Bryobacteraceae bacterium]
MEPRYFYRMCDAKQALLCVRDLEELSIYVDMGVVALLDANTHTDWYVFADMKSPSAEEAALIKTILSQRGQRSEPSLIVLRRDRKVLF